MANVCVRARSNWPPWLWDVGRGQRNRGDAGRRRRGDAGRRTTQPRRRGERGGNRARSASEGPRGGVWLEVCGVHVATLLGGKERTIGGVPPTIPESPRIIRGVPRTGPGVPAKLGGRLATADVGPRLADLCGPRALIGWMGAGQRSAARSRASPCRCSIRIGRIMTPGTAQAAAQAELRRTVGATGTRTCPWATGPTSCR